MSDQSQKPEIPTQMPPDAPEELQAQRQAIVDGLEAASKTATGALQPVLRVMAQVLHSCRPGSSLDGGFDRGMREAMQRYEPEMAKNPWPPVFEDAVRWMQDYLTARGFKTGDQSYPPRPEKATNRVAGALDMFEKISSGMPSLSGEAPVGPRSTDAGSVKNWQLNPGIGKVRG